MTIVSLRTGTTLLVFVLWYPVAIDGFYRAKLEGCILGRSTKVGAKAELSKCVTQAGFEADAGGDLSLHL